MKGLMLKDLYSNMRNIRYYLLFLLFFAAMGFFMKNPAYISMLQVIIGVNLGFSVFHYDEYNKWDVFALALPLTRKTMVKTRYLEGLIVSLGIAVDCGILGCITAILLKVDYLDALVSCFACLIASVFLLAFLFPFIYKMGVERARMVLLILIVGLMAVFVLGSEFVDSLNIMTVMGTMSSVSTVIITIIVVSFILYFLSYIVSFRIYSKKEF